MNKKIKMKCMIIIIVILSMILGGFTIWRIDYKKRKNKDPRECVEKKLDIELGDGVVLVEGDAYDEYGEEYVDAKFVVDKKGLEELKTELEENLNQYSLEEIELFCNLKRDDIWLDLKEKEILYFYHQFREGNRAKTIEITAFIATDSTGKYYFYIFY